MEDKTILEEEIEIFRERDTPICILRTRYSISNAICIYDFYLLIIVFDSGESEYNAEESKSIIGNYR